MLNVIVLNPLFSKLVCDVNPITLKSLILIGLIICQLTDPIYLFFDDVTALFAPSFFWEIGLDIS